MVALCETSRSSVIIIILIRPSFFMFYRPQLAEVWDDRKSAKKNLAEMGLSYDSNVSVRRSSKSARQKSEADAQKANTAAVLEKQAKTPRKVDFKFPKAQAIYFSYLISKYGDNYKEMTKDPKNIYQETWKQIRSKITKFKKLEQYRKMMCNA
ncbi:nucleolar protein 16 isoform X2 [Planococcus citri]|uniref:nucleolar protein 16 isoform X2 n=1 Tax=Planococcus citri TaxID=170843 RepID=UPI0031F72A76